MTKQEFLSELERALGKLPHTEVEQALAFYDEAISDRMEDGISEAEAVSDLGPIDEITAQITAETPPIPRAIARANTGSRALNIVLLAVFSPIWVPIAFALTIAALSIYFSIWVVIVSLWIVDAALMLMPFAGLTALVSLAGGGHVVSGIFALGLTLIVGGVGLIASFGVFWASKLLYRTTRAFARWVASLFIRVSGHGHGDEPAGHSDGGVPSAPTCTADTIPSPITEEGDLHA